MNTLRNSGNVYCGLSQSFKLFYGNKGCRVLQDKEEKNHPDCYQHEVPKPGFVMVWRCISAHGMDNLNIVEGTITTERYTHLGETYAC